LLAEEISIREIEDRGVRNKGEWDVLEGLKGRVEELRTVRLQLALAEKVWDGKLGHQLAAVEDVLGKAWREVRRIAGVEGKS